MQELLFFFNFGLHFLSDTYFKKALERNTIKAKLFLTFPVL